MKRCFYLLSAIQTFVLLILSDQALASRLEIAAKNAQSSVLAIAQVTSGIGIAIGGILMSVGWSSAGRMLLGGSLIGVFASFGGPAVIELIKGLF